MFLNFRNLNSIFFYLLICFSFSQLYSCALINPSSNKELAEKTVEEKKAEIYFNQGTNDLFKKNYNEALSNLMKAKELEPKNSQIRNNFGMALYFKDQKKLAEIELLKSIDLDNNNSDAKVNLAALYLEENRLKDAKKLYILVEKDLVYPGQFRNLYNFALLYLKEGDRASCITYLQKSLKEKIDYCPASFKLGELYYEEYKFQEALAAFKEAGKGTCVTEPAPLYYQALVLINLNRPAEAKIKLNTIISKFQMDRYSTLAKIELNKLLHQNTDNAINQKTEKIKELQTIESPNF